MLRPTFALALLLVLPPIAPAQMLTEAERKEGFFSLFDGKSFAGWRFDASSALGAIPKNWSIGDGCIQLQGGAKPHLASQWYFDDFEMRFEWKAYRKGYNSGFYIRSGRNVGVNQINLAEKDCGHLMSKVKGGGAAVPELQNPVGEWNDWKLVAVDDKATFWVNGTQAWSVTELRPGSGYVGLQAEGAKIDFRNLRVRELGFQRLGELSAWKPAEGWSQEGDVLKGNKWKSLATKEAYRDFTLRLEFQAPFGSVMVGQKGWLTLSDASLAPSMNPVGQWNYLQLGVRQGKSTVWLNGNNIKTTPDPGGVAGPILLDPGEGEMLVRNIRIRKMK